MRFGDLCHSSLGDEAFVYQVKAYPIADRNERCDLEIEKARSIRIGLSQ